MSSLNRSRTLADIRDQIHAITGADAYSAGDIDRGERLPLAIMKLPVMLVIPGPTRAYEHVGGHQKHDYEVRILALAASLDAGVATYDLVPWVDAIMDRFAGHLKMGRSEITFCRFDRTSGLATIEWALVPFIGEEITLLVREEATVTTGVGA